MIKYLLDTNVLSEAVKTSPLPAVLDKLSRHRDELATATPVWHELLYGCCRLPPSRKRKTIETYLYQVVLPNLPISLYTGHGVENMSMKFWKFGNSGLSSIICVYGFRRLPATGRPQRRQPPAA